MMQQTITPGSGRISIMHHTIAGRPPPAAPCQKMTCRPRALPRPAIPLSAPHGPVRRPGERPTSVSTPNAAPENDAVTRRIAERLYPGTKQSAAGADASSPSGAAVIPPPRRHRGRSRIVTPAHAERRARLAATLHVQRRQTPPRGTCGT